MTDDEKYWLLHKGGYAMVKLLRHEDDGRARIQVAGKQMVVDRADVDKVGILERLFHPYSRLSG